MLHRLIISVALGTTLLFAQNIDYSRIRNGPGIADSSFATLTAACSGAQSASRPLVLTRVWTVATGFTCAANLVPAGGIIKPASGQTVNITGAITTSPGVQIFDTSLGGAITLSATCCTSLSPNWWGAVADWNSGSETGTDNATAFTAAKTAGIAASIPMSIPCGSYRLGSTFSIRPLAPIAWEYYGCSSARASSTTYGTNLIFTSGGIAYSNYAQNIFAHDFGIIAWTTGGPNLSIQGNSGSDEFRNISFISFNAVQSLVDADAGLSGDLDQLTFIGDEFTAPGGYSVPPIYFHTTGGAIAPVAFDNQYVRQWTGSTTASVPFFKADCSGASNPCRAFAFYRILTESTPYGAFDFNNVTSVHATDVTVADAAIVHRPQVKIIAPSGQTIGVYDFDNPDIQDGTDDLLTPSLLVDVGASNGQGYVTLHGGQVSFGRIINNTRGMTMLAVNTKVASPYDFTIISTVQTSVGTGLPRQGADGPVNATNFNAGTQFIPSSSAAALVNAKCVKASDLVIDATDTHRVTSASWTPNDDDIGRYIQIYSGSGFNTSVGNRIIKVAGGAAFLVSEAGTAGSTGGVFTTNRWSLGFEDDRYTPSDRSDYLLACSANADATVSAKQIPMTIPTTAFASLPSVSKPTFAIISDSTTNTWGANVAGGGANTVLAFWNGTNWTVVAK